MARESERQERKRKDQERAAANLKRQSRPTAVANLRPSHSDPPFEEAVDQAMPAPTPKKKVAVKKKPAAKKKAAVKKPAAKPQK